MPKTHILLIISESICISKIETVCDLVTMRNIHLNTKIYDYMYRNLYVVVILKSKLMFSLFELMLECSGDLSTFLKCL